MFCTSCGKEMVEEDRYCSRCGKAARPGYKSPRRLMRSMSDKKVAGVCSGFARYFDVDVTLMRLIWIALIFFSAGTVLIAYLIAWIVMPRDDLDVQANTVHQPQGSQN